MNMRKGGETGCAGLLSPAWRTCGCVSCTGCPKSNTAAETVAYPRGVRDSCGMHGNREEAGLNCVDNRRCER